MGGGDEGGRGEGWFEASPQVFLHTPRFPPAVGKICFTGKYRAANYLRQKRRGMTRNYNCKFSLSPRCSHFFLRELTSVLWVKWAREEKEREPRKSFFAGFELLCNHWNASRGGICLSIGRENGIGLLLLLLFLSFPCLEIEGRRRKRISFSFLSEWRREEEEGEVTSPFDIHKKVPSSFLFSPRCMKRAAGTGFSKQKWQNKSRSHSY